MAVLSSADSAEGLCAEDSTHVPNKMGLYASYAHVCVQGHVRSDMGSAKPVHLQGSTIVFTSYKASVVLGICQSGFLTDGFV